MVAPYKPRTKAPGHRSGGHGRWGATRVTALRRYDAAAVADATKAPPAPTSSAELLEREGAQRKRAGFAAILSALFVTVSFLITSAISSGAPGVLITDALRDGAGETLQGENGPGLLAQNLTYLHEKAAVSGLGTIFEVLGWIGFAILLLFLYDATRGRRPEAPFWLRPLLLASVIATIIGVVMIWLGQTISFNDFVSGSDHSSKAARDAVTTPLIGIGGPLRDFGRLGAAIAWMLISFHAMRAGLLTRFLGTLGMIAAVLTFVILQLPILEIFWLLAVGLMVLDKAPSGQPPAWKSGKSEPWPTQQELREMRAKQQEQSANGSEDGPEESVQPSPATSARKRKRRQAR